MKVRPSFSLFQFFVVLLLIGAALSAPAGCPNAKCMNVVNESYCFDSAVIPYKIYNCPDKKVCAYATHTCVSIPDPPTPSNIQVGNKADKDEYCFTKKRDSKGYCTGKAAGETCGVNECNANTRCNGTHCAALLKDGENCTNSGECLIGSGCNEKKCIARFTLAAGVQTAEESLCISGHTFEGKCVTTTTVTPSWLNISQEIAKACHYDGDRLENGICLAYSEDSTTTGMCREFHGGYLDGLKEMKKYWDATVNYCPQYNPLCELGLDSIDACISRKVLEGMQYFAKKMASKIASCMPSPVDNRFEKYKCFSSSLFLGLLTFLAIIFLL